jgi:hypothetical protein
VSVVDKDGSELVSVPLTMKLAYPGTAILTLIFFSSVLIAGSFYSFALAGHLTASSSVVSVQSLSAYVRWWVSLEGILAVLFGTAAVFTVYNGQYLTSDTWGASPKEVGGLLVALLGAFISAATVSHLRRGT